MIELSFLTRTNVKRLISKSKKKYKNLLTLKITEKY